MNHALISSIAKEIGFWFLLPTLFIFTYVFYFSHPTSAISSHLYIVFLIASLVFIFKLYIYKWLDIKVAFVICTWIYASILTCLLFYYGLVIIGLRSWGRVITEELIMSYGRQLDLLSKAIDVSYYMVIAVIFLFYIAVITFCGYLFYKQQFNAPTFVKKINPFIRHSFTLSIIIIFLIKIADFYRNPDYSIKEPTTQTLYAGKNVTQKNSGHIKNDDPQLEEQERLVKASYKASPNAHKKNVVLIIVDALRPDHMGVYNYHRNNSPYLSQLQQEGKLIKINQVRGSCGESSCGLISITSSKFKHQVPSEPYSLQHALKVQGYEVNMILGGDHTNFYNLRTLYGPVDYFYDGSHAKNYYMNDDSFVIDQVKKLSKWNGKPTMFQFHLMSSHTLGKRFEQYNVYTPYKRYAGKTSGEPKLEFTNHYDNGVLQTDDIVKQILTTLKNKQYLDDALIVITADHGEGLGEHQLFSHSNSVREELLKLPLLLINFKNNINQQAKEKLITSQLDIAPTILYEMNMSIPSSWYGQPLQTYQKKLDAQNILYFQQGENIGIYDLRAQEKQWKYWLNLNTNEEFVYNINIDPKEKNNLTKQISIEKKKEWRKLVSASIRLR